MKIKLLSLHRFCAHCKLDDFGWSLLLILEQGGNFSNSHLWYWEVLVHHQPYFKIIYVLFLPDHADMTSLNTCFHHLDFKPHEYGDFCSS